MGALKVSVATISALALNAFAHYAVLAKVSVQRQVQFFTIIADDAPSLKSQLTNKPVPGVSDTNTRMAAMSYQLEMHGDLRTDNGRRCSTDDVHIKLTVVIYLPLLITKSPRLNAQWIVFSDYARRHEEAHANLAIKYAHRLEARLTGLIARDCQTLAAKAQEILNKVDAQLQRDEVSLERTTSLDDFFY